MRIGPASAVLLLILVGHSIPGIGQPRSGKQTPWAHPHDSLSFSGFDPESGALLECSPNGYRIYRKETGAGPFVPVTGLGAYFAHFVFPVKGSGGSEWILVNDMGGRTFRLSGSTLTQIDHRSPNRMAVTMAAFQWRDTIFSQGGYGFWSAREYVIWFDPSSGEWNPHQLRARSDLPPGILNHWAHLAGDSLYVFGGNVLDPFDPVNHLPNTDLWRYDLQGRRWHDLGRINEELAIVKNGQVTLKIGDRLLLYPIKKMMAEVDFHAGRIRYYQPTAIMEDLVSHGHPTLFRAFTENGQLHYCRITDNRVGFNPPHRSEWVSIPFSQLYGQPAGEESLFERRYALWWWLVLPVLIGLSVAVWKRVHSSDSRIRMREDGFIHRGTHFPLSPERVRLINLLLGADQPVPNSAVMELFLNPTLDYSNNIRMKNQMVEKTNILLKSVLNVEDDPIVCDRSTDDKRMRNYSIRKEYFKSGKR